MTRRHLQIAAIYIALMAVSLAFVACSATNVDPYDSNRLFDRHQRSSGGGP